MEHSLRTLPEYFQAVKRGDKLFELRFDDRGYAAGDTLLLREYEPIGDHYSGDTVRVRVTYSLRGAPWLAPGYVAMSIRLIDEATERVHKLFMRKLAAEYPDHPWIKKEDAE